MIHGLIPSNQQSSNKIWSITHLNQHKYQLSKNFSPTPLLVESPHPKKKRADRLPKKIVNAHGSVPRILRDYSYNSHQSIKRKVRKNIEQRSRQFNDPPPNVKGSDAARALWRLSILSRPGKQKLIRSSRNVCSPYESSTGDSETRLPDLLFLPGRNSFAPLESSSTATTPAVFRRRRPPNDARMSTAIVVLPPPLVFDPSTPPTLLLLLLLYFSPSPSLRPKVFLFPPSREGLSSRFGGTNAGES